MAAQRPAHSRKEELLAIVGGHTHDEGEVFGCCSVLCHVAAALGCPEERAATPLVTWHKVVRRIDTGKMCALPRRHPLEPRSLDGADDMVGGHRAGGCKIRPRSDRLRSRTEDSRASEALLPHPFIHSLTRTHHPPPNHLPLTEARQPARLDSGNGGPRGPRGPQQRAPRASSSPRTQARPAPRPRPGQPREGLALVFVLLRRAPAAPSRGPNRKPDAE